MIFWRNKYTPLTEYYIQFIESEFHDSIHPPIVNLNYDLTTIHIQTKNELSFTISFNTIEPKEMNYQLHYKEMNLIDQTSHYNQKDLEDFIKVCQVCDLTLTLCNYYIQPIDLSDVITNLIYTHTVN